VYLVHGWDSPKTSADPTASLVCFLYDGSRMLTKYRVGDQDWQAESWGRQDVDPDDIFVRDFGRLGEPVETVDFVA
jgi:hypothetical protein